MIPVTKSFLPPINEYETFLKRAWENEWLTNRGELVKELESKLSNYLDVKRTIAMTNGTLPLQIAIKALGLKGEIITTPFSYVATTSSIVWEGCTPVFVDIHPDFLTIDETKIEAAITNKTTAIMATHVFGNPCHVEEIERIAKMHNLKVIYDAAHCFGVQYKGQSVFNYGDVSTCSFHATKIFHTGEGGALFCNDEEMFDTYFYHHNFGHDGPEKFHGLGINAKMSELQAAMGLAVLPYMSEVISCRKMIWERYYSGLRDLNLNFLTVREDAEMNYSYFPIIFNSEEKLIMAIQKLNSSGIFPRRYFYPSLDSLPYISGSSMHISQSISKRVLCLPLFYGLGEEVQISIINILNSIH
jgi:dTDP-4-amino-4,6-dideoxygalactose transaminase